MLLLMRKRIGSIIVKAFAFLLILGFGAWGIQDMLGYQVGGGGAVAEVGDARLGPQRFYREVSQEVARMRPLFGGRLDIEQARRFGLVDMILNREIDAMATVATADNLGIAVSDTLVRQNILNEPMFKGLAGNFDRGRFQQILQSNGLTEGDFVNRVRQDIASAQLLESVSGGARAPKSWVHAVYRFREEKRATDTVFIPDASGGMVNEPADTQLRSFYDSNKQTYTAPEYRSLTYVDLNADELAKEISVSDEDLREAYEQRADEFTTQETRTVRQMIVADETKAKAAHQRVSEGADFLEIAKEVAGLDAAAVELGEITKADLLPELADGVFSAEKGKATEPAKSALGWHVFQVTDIKPGGSMSFEDAKPQLQSEMAREKAIDGLYDLSNAFEDALGGGATLEEAAAQQNLKVLKLDAIDNQGKDRSGKAIENLPAGGNFISTAFATEETAESSMTEAGDSGFFILRVDKVTAPALRPFEEVQGNVLAAWSAEERRKQAEARAKTITDAVNEGKTLADAVGVMGLEIKAGSPITRDGRGGGADFNAELIGEVFKLSVGKAALGRVGNGYRVAVLKSVETPDPATDKKGVDELRATLSQSLQGDVAGQLRTAFRNEVGVTVYQATIDQLIGTGQQ